MISQKHQIAIFGQFWGQKRSPSAFWGSARRHARGPWGGIIGGGFDNRPRFPAKISGDLDRQEPGKTLDLESSTPVPRQAGGGGSLTRIPPGQGFKEIV